MSPTKRLNAKRIKMHAKKSHFSQVELNSVEFNKAQIWRLNRLSDLSRITRHECDTGFQASDFLCKMKCIYYQNV